MSMLSSTPKEATVTQQTQRRFKSSLTLNFQDTYRKLVDIVDSTLSKMVTKTFDLKNSGLIVRSPFSCQRYMVHKGFARNIRGDHDLLRYTLHNDCKRQRSFGHPGHRSVEQGIFYLINGLVMIY